MKEDLFILVYRAQSDNPLARCMLRAGNKEYTHKIIAGIRNDAKGLGWIGMDNYKSCKIKYLSRSDIGKEA
jgi:hypothetical protein